MSDPTEPDKAGPDLDALRSGVISFDGPPALPEVTDEDRNWSRKITLNRIVGLDEPEAAPRPDIDDPPVEEG